MNDILTAVELHKYISRYYRNKEYYIAIRKQEKPYLESNPTLFVLNIYKQRTVTYGGVCHDIHKHYFIKEELYNQISDKYLLTTFESKDSSLKKVLVSNNFSEIYSTEDFLNLLLSRSDVIDMFLKDVE